MPVNFDKNNSLQQLEKTDWGEPGYPSHLVKTCHRLHRKPLSEFTTEDLRIMIGQNFGLKYLIPMAIETLRENPFASGDLYDGDLLRSVLQVKPQFWRENPDLWVEVGFIADRVEMHIKSLEKMFVPSIKNFRDSIY